MHVRLRIKTIFLQSTTFPYIVGSTQEQFIYWLSAHSHAKTFSVELENKCTCSTQCVNISIHLLSTKCFIIHSLANFFPGVYRPKDVFVNWNYTSFGTLFDKMLVKTKSSFVRIFSFLLLLLEIIADW